MCSQAPWLRDFQAMAEGPDRGAAISGWSWDGSSHQGRTVASAPVISAPRPRHNTRYACRLAVVRHLQLHTLPADKNGNGSSAGWPAMTVPFKAIPKQSLQPGSWYYGVSCHNCGQQLIVLENSRREASSESWTLHRAIPVECECGAVNLVQRFERFRTP